MDNNLLFEQVLSPLWHKGFLNKTALCPENKTVFLSNQKHWKHFWDENNRFTAEIFIRRVECISPMLAVA